MEIGPQIEVDKTEQLPCISPLPPISFHPTGSGATQSSKPLPIGNVNPKQNKNAAVVSSPGHAAPKRALSILYVFAGRQRKADIRDCLEGLQKEWNFLLFMKEVDLLRCPEQDITQEAYWHSLLQEIDLKQYHLLIITPPCNTFSRARSNWRTHPGPRPLRSKEFPWGFPWLENRNKSECEMGNLLLRRTWEAISHAQDSDTRFILEHPEDLGRTTQNDTPASIWQFEETQELIASASAVTWALFQCKYDAPTSKPTRLASDLVACREETLQEWPSFDTEGFYTGPLPRLCEHKGHKEKLKGRNEDGSFKTAPSAAYPPALCAHLALLIVRSFYDASLKGGL